jgi:hypothetical protein
MAKEEGDWFGQLVVAYHEAGHAVAALKQGIPVLGLTVVPKTEGTEVCLGHCEHPGLYACKPRSDQEKRTIARKLILVDYAGPAAEDNFCRIRVCWSRLIRDTTLDGDGPEDFRDAYYLAGEAIRHPRFFDRDDHHRYLIGMWRKARRFVKDQWADIHLLAQKLYQRKTLTQEEIGPCRCGP